MQLTESAGWWMGDDDSPSVEISIAGGVRKMVRRHPNMQSWAFSVLGSGLKHLKPPGDPGRAFWFSKASVGVFYRLPLVGWYVDHARIHPYDIWLRSTDIRK